MIAYLLRTTDPRMHSSAREVFSDHHQLISDKFLNWKKLNYEEERIKSFASWPVHLPVDPNRLAKAGFYYSGTGDEVICFSCQGHVKNWNYDDVVLKKHAEMYPDCDFINDRSNNVPLIKLAATKSKDHSLITESADKMISNISLCNSNVDFSKMKSESERLKTLVEKWPLSYIDTVDLANAGFFYLGIGDKVQCAYCKGIISNWEVGDIPSQEHLRHFPYCDYVSESIVKAKNGLSWYEGSSEDICGNMKECVNANSYKSSKKRLIDKTQQHTTLEDLGVHLHESPAHPQQSSLAARLRSFASWPSDVPVSKEDLAAAGFFYIGISDHTKCFHCNGGLCNWEKGDDPWVEHARWFCNCDYLRLTKGSDFIKSCLAKNSARTLKEDVYQLNHQNLPMISLLDKVDEAMKSSLVKYVLESELFPPYIVRAAVLLQIKDKGVPFSTTDDLCIAASFLKEKMEKEPMELVKASDLNICETTNNNCSTNDVCPGEENVSIPETSGSQQSNRSEGSFNNGQSVIPGNSLPEEDTSKDHCLCKICMDKEVGVVFLPCGHLLTCTSCAPALKHCPLCRKAIQATVRVYLN